MFTQATLNDINELAELFWNNIEVAPEYISHGEIQMGVATAPGILAPDGIQVWKEYIREKIEGEDVKTAEPCAVEKCKCNTAAVEYPTAVFVHRNSGKIDAFCVLEITDDGNKPFGTICDMLVLPHLRGEGMGKKLLAQAKEWFAANGVTDIYLESGLNNHSAHEFFRKQGFREISHIFKLM